MSNREALAAVMPAMLRHEGCWEGTYRFVDADGQLTDEYSSRIDCLFPDDGPFVYVQKNHYAWPDGRVFENEFGGELRGDRIWWDTDRFSGYGWVTADDIVMLTLDRKDEPGVSFTEIIMFCPDPRYRTRTWHWFREGRLLQRTLCEERRVSG